MLECHPEFITISDLHQSELSSMDYGYTVGGRLPYAVVTVKLF